MTDHKDTDSKNNLSAEDNALWNEMMRDVKPIEHDKKHVDPPLLAKKEDDRAPRQVAYSSRPAAAPSQPAQSKRKGRDIDAKTLKRLERGELPIQGQLDLHGLNQADARQALFRFIQNAQASGKRCVLVITGKGSTQKTSENWLDREAGVLKRNTPGWLREGALADIVLTAVPAQIKHGGSGALYVYLRRNRD